MPTNRIVILGTSVITLLLAILPAVLNFDWSSTAGIIAAIVFILGALRTWLEGWQKHEEQLHGQNVNLNVNTTTDDPGPEQAAKAVETKPMSSLEAEEKWEASFRPDPQSTLAPMYSEGEGVGDEDDTYKFGIDDGTDVWNSEHEQRDIHDADEQLSAIANADEEEF